MSTEYDASRREISLYIEYAHRMLKVASHNLTGGFCGSAINRAYYAVFYAANALLATEGLSRSKHSGVIAAFRKHFKPGLVEVEYSDIYGRVMEDRHVSDYDIDLPIDPQVTEDDLRDALRFEEYLQEEGWL